MAKQEGNKFEIQIHSAFKSLIIPNHLHLNEHFASTKNVWQRKSEEEEKNVKELNKFH